MFGFLNKDLVLFLFPIAVFLIYIVWRKKRVLIRKINELMEREIEEIKKDHNPNNPDHVDSALRRFNARHSEKKRSGKN